MTIEQKITDIIAPSLEDAGYNIVQLRYDSGDNARLQIMAERISDGQFSLDDCQKLSHIASELLDVEDPINEAYNLEVSSPGIDRPLVRLADFIRYIGHAAKFKLAYPVEGQRKLSATITDVIEKDEMIVVEKADGSGMEIEIPFETIEQSKLILTDKLIEKNKEEIGA